MQTRFFVLSFRFKVTPSKKVMARQPAGNVIVDFFQFSRLNTDYFNIIIELETHIFNDLFFIEKLRKSKL